MLIILGGLPGSGKTTIARALAKRLRAVHVRIDTIEQGIRASGVPGSVVGAAGYVAASAWPKTTSRSAIPSSPIPSMAWA